MSAALADAVHWDTSVVTVYCNECTDSGYYLTTDPISDPHIQWLRWVIASHEEGWNSVIRNGLDVFNTFSCPYELEDPNWEVVTETGEWEEDETLTVTCTKYKN